MGRGMAKDLPVFLVVYDDIMCALGSVIALSLSLQHCCVVNCFFQKILRRTESDSMSTVSATIAIIHYHRCDRFSFFQFGRFSTSIA